jgi:GntR family transcriptional repressor for pyruvate dehydrogenase complex
MEFRAIVESAAAALAAKRASAVDRRALECCFAAMEEAHKNEDVEAIAKTDGDFHFAVYDASHNTMLLQIMRSLEPILRSNVHLNRKNLYEHRREPDQELAEHRAVLQAIMARDPERAEHAARQHMMSTTQTQREIHEEERRLQTAICRLARDELLARPKGTGSPAPSRSPHPRRKVEDG